MRLDGDKVRRGRELQGLTVEEFARRANLAKGTAVKAEHGGEILPGTARRIAEALGTGIPDLAEELISPLAGAR